MASLLFRSQLTTPSSNPQATLKKSESTNEARDLLTQIRNSPNPQQMFNTLKQTNPLMRQTQQLIDYYGNGDPRAAVMAMAKECGIDPSSILSSLGLNGIQNPNG